ncbi:MAG: PAS domain S-box protein, partial [Magnetococcales bacterium]|nr:PAS domain S-box protein [Magnetococcales bacterium]
MFVHFEKQQVSSEKSGRIPLRFSWPYFPWLDRNFFIGFLIWSILIALSISWNIFKEYQQTEKLIIHVARANFDKDVAFRLWGTSHGGVYVPVDERTPPNPYLAHIPERDITTPSGRQLTLMNPAYMVRQMMNDFAKLYGIMGRITSLKYLNPNNAPDAWERDALLAFEQGKKEVLMFTVQDGQRVLRLMRPMITEEKCLKCHGHQNYKVGDVRGGVGVSVPIAPYQAFSDISISALIFTYGTIWLLGLLAIAFSFQKSWQRLDTLRLAKEKIEHANFAMNKIQEQLAKAQEIAHLGSWSIEIPGKETFWSQEFSRIYDIDEWTQGSSLDRFFSETIHPEDRKRVESAVRASMDDPNIPYEVECRLRRKDGSVRFVHALGETILNESGQPIRMVGTVQDITEAVLTAERLTQSENRFRTIFEQAAVGVALIHSFTGRFVQINQRYADIVGYSVDEMLAQTFQQITHPDDLVEDLANMERLLKGEIVTFTMEKRYYHRTGAIIWVRLTVSPIWKSGEKATHHIAVVEDISENKLAENAIREAKEAAEVASRAKSDFLTTMSHEIRTPISVVLGMTEILRSTELSMEQRDYLARLRGAGKNLLNLINQILELAKLEAGCLKIVETSVQIRKIINDSAELLLILAHDKGLSMNCHVAEDVPDWLITDGDRLTQVLSNLLGNAIKFTDKGKISLNAGIDTQSSDLLHLTIEDTGIGINTDAMVRIFTQFTQGDSSTARRFGG